MTGIPAHWEEVELAELMLAKTEVINPTDYPDMEFELWSVPAFPTDRPEIVLGRAIGSTKQRVRPNDVLLCKINPRINRVWKVGPAGAREQIASTEWIVLRCAYVDADFLAQRLREPRFREQLCSEVSGVGGSLTRARPQAVRKLKISLPPQGEQARIAGRLRQVDEVRSRVSMILEEVPIPLEKFRQSVLASAFRGDLTADWRSCPNDIEPASELLVRIRTERAHRWRERHTGKSYVAPAPTDGTEQPDLPTGWCWARWEEVGFCQNGRAFPSSAYIDHGVKLLRPGNLHVSGRLEWAQENTRFLPERWAADYPDYIVGVGEIVMNLTAQSLKDEFLGRVCLTSEGEQCLLNQRIARLTPVLLSPRFCLWLLKSSLFRAYVSKLNTGSLIQHMFTSQVNDFVFPLPPLAEQEEIVRRIEACMSKHKALTAAYEWISSSLSALERATLAQAFRGELVPQDLSDEPASALLTRIPNGRTASITNRSRAKPRSASKK